MRVNFLEFLSFINKILNKTVSYTVGFKRNLKMMFPLSFWGLSLWIAVTAFILLLTSELLSPYYGRTNICIDKKRLRMVSVTFGVIFLFIVVIKILEMILLA